MEAVASAEVESAAVREDEAAETTADVSSSPPSPTEVSAPRGGASSRLSQPSWQATEKALTLFEKRLVTGTATATALVEAAKLLKAEPEAANTEPEAATPAALESSVDEDIVSEELPEAKAETPPSQPKARRTVSFKESFEEAARRRQTAFELMKSVQKPKYESGSIGSSWKRLPKHCRNMRGELSRSVFATFLSSIREEFEVPQDVNPLSEFEDRQIAAVIKKCDVVALVKHLAETELHIRFGPKRSRITPEAPLNMRIFANLQRERAEMAATWGVQEQALREERVMGLFLDGPFTWKSIRQLLWDAQQFPPALQDIHCVTDEEERKHGIEVRQLTWYQDQLRHKATEAFCKRLEAPPEELPDHAQVAPVGLIDALKGQGSLGLAIPKALLPSKKKAKKK